MFDLIVLYLVISFLVNVIKESRGKQNSSGQKRQTNIPPRRKNIPSGREKPPVAQRMETPRQTAEELARKPVSQTKQPSVKKQGINANVAVPQNKAADRRREKSVLPVVGKEPEPAFSEKHNFSEVEKLQQVLEPTEENVLAGFVWSEILGPPKCKRR